MNSVSIRLHPIYIYIGSANFRKPEGSFLYTKSESRFLSESSHIATTTMKRISGIAAIGNKAIEGFTAGKTTTGHRLQQAARYTNSCNSSSFAKSPLFSRCSLVDHLGLGHSTHSSSAAAAHGVSPKMFFSATAASSLAEEVQATEPPHYTKFLPKDVVLYQYEACPFCNKVKGVIISYSFVWLIFTIFNTLCCIIFCFFIFCFFTARYIQFHNKQIYLLSFDLLTVA